MSFFSKLIDFIIKDLILTAKSLEGAIYYVRNLFVLDFYEIHKKHFEEEQRKKDEKKEKCESYARRKEGKEEKKEEKIFYASEEEAIEAMLKKEKNVYTKLGAKSIREHYASKFFKEDSFLFIDLI